MISSVLNNFSSDVLDYFYITCEDLIAECSGSAAGAIALIIGAEKHAYTFGDSPNVYACYGLECSVLQMET